MSGSSSRPQGSLDRLQRIRRREDFQQIQTRGRRLTTARFVFAISARPDDAGPRLGVTASRKIGGAVVRNRAKRLVREAFRATRELWVGSIDVVVIVRRDLTDGRLEGVVAEWLTARRSIARRTEEARRLLARGGRDDGAPHEDAARGAPRAGGPRSAPVAVGRAPSRHTGPSGAQADPTGASEVSASASPARRGSAAPKRRGRG